jgi:hypothetical protein
LPHSNYHFITTIIKIAEQAVSFLSIEITPTHTHRPIIRYRAVRAFGAFGHCFTFLKHRQPVISVASRMEK